MAQTAERLKDSLKYLLVSGMFFEELGFTYLGPIDGHSYEELLENLQYAKKTEGPVLLHVLTKKERDLDRPNSIKKGLGTGQALIKWTQAI